MTKKERTRIEKHWKEDIKEKTHLYRVFTQEIDSYKQIVTIQGYPFPKIRISTNSYNTEEESQLYIKELEYFMNILNMMIDTKKMNNNGGIIL